MSPRTPQSQGGPPLRIVILGTGEVSQVLTPALIDRGHEVLIGTRDPDRTATSNTGHRQLSQRYPQVSLLTFKEAAAASDPQGLVINAISGPVCVGALAPLATELRGRVVMDVSSPYDWSRPDAVIHPVNTDSLGEMIQRALPGALVVKTLNTVAAGLMVDPAALGEIHTAFLSGDDASAKARVADLLQDLGWEDVLDLGGIITSRATEMFLRLWLDTAQSLGTSDFGFRLVR